MQPQPNMCLNRLHMLTGTGQTTDSNCWASTCLLDQVNLVSPTHWRYTCSVCIYTEHSITTVLLQYAILYKDGMNIVIISIL